MKYDLIIAGGGPGGLTAAWTAARDGLKVLLVERKKELTEINRLCGQFANISMISVTGIYKYGYSEALHLEIGTDKTTVHWPAIGFSMDYGGPLKPYLNYIHFSPSGHRLYRIKDHFFGYYWEKESLLEELLNKATGAGATVVTGSVVRGVENTADGVRVTVENKAGTVVHQASKLIAADGKDSKTAAQLGVFEGRRVSELPHGGVGFVVEGVDTDFGLNGWLCFTVPSLSPIGNLWMFQVTGDRYIVGTSQRHGSSASESTERFMQLPYFKPWFAGAKVVRKLAFGSMGLLKPLTEPVAGNVLILGEAAGVGETSIPGAIACGFQAAKAVLKELNGTAGFADYCGWWAQAFEGVDPIHGKAAGRFFVLNSLCTDEEVDYLYQAYAGEVGVPAITIASDLDRIKPERPELYEKLKATGMAEGLKGMKLDYGQLLDNKV